MHHPSPPPPHPPTPPHLPRPHQPLVTLILPLTTPHAALPTLVAIEHAFAATPHEIIATYDDASRSALAAMEALPARPPTLRLISADDQSPLSAAAPLAAGDVVLVLSENPHLPASVQLVTALRASRCAIGIAPQPRGKRSLALLDFLLAAVAGMPVWNPLTGHRAYAAAFLDTLDIRARSPLAVRLELLLHAQAQNAPVGMISTAHPRERLPPPADLLELTTYLRQAIWRPLAVWGMWLVMTCAALLAAAISGHAFTPGIAANVLLPAAAAFAFTLAVRRIRGRTRIADAFFSLVLLNPLFVARGIQPFDPTLVAAGLLGLLAGAIIAMKRDKPRRYLAITGLALLLAAISDAFILLLPALAAWLTWVGYTHALSKSPADRTRGFVILAAGEIAFFTFGLAAILIAPTPTPHPRTLFATIVSFTEFPLLVLAIVTLALGWRPAPVIDFSPPPEASPAAVSPPQAPHLRRPRRKPRGTAPPYFAGMLAFLLGLLAMLLNNFQSGTLPSPGADQTVVILCVLYTVFALHGPRRLQSLAPPLLLAAAASYLLLRWKTGA